MDQNSASVGRLTAVPAVLLGRLGGGMSRALAGNVANAAAQWLALVFLAKCTSQHDVGIYALALAICGPIVLFTNLQLSALQSTDANRAFSFQQYFALRLWTSLASLVLIVAVSVAWRMGPTGLAVLTLLGVARSCEAISDVVYGALMRRAQFGLISRNLAANGLLSLALFALAAYVTRDARWAVLGWTAGSAIVLGAANLPMAVRMHSPHRFPSSASLKFLLAECGQWRRLRALVSLALPMGVISTLLSVQANGPQYVLQHFLGPVAVGAFALLAYPFIAGSLVVTAMGQTAAPHFADALERDDGTQFRHILMMTLAGGLALGIGTIAAVSLWGGAFLALVYGQRYSAYESTFVLLAWSVAIRFAYLPVGVAATVQRRLRVQVWLRVAALAGTVVACVAGVLWRGLEGVAVALILSAIGEGMLWISVGIACLRADGRAAVSAGAA